MLTCTENTLHTINQPSAFALALPHFEAGDALLFLEDAVLLLNSDFALPNTMQCYALGPDIAARAVKINNTQPVSVIGYDEFADLSLRHARVTAWS